MKRPPTRSSDALALQIQAERAGFAWACPFSTSDEFEAAVIRSRARVGAYGRPRRYGLVAILAMAGLVICCLMLS